MVGTLHIVTQETTFFHWIRTMRAMTSQRDGLATFGAIQDDPHPENCTTCNLAANLRRKRSDPPLLIRMLSVDLG